MTHCPNWESAGSLARRRRRAPDADLGQGGAQAIEDGVVLGDVLRPHADPIAVLREYELRRMPIAYDILRWVMDHRLAQFENPLLCALRNQTVRILPSAAARLIGVRRPQWVETGPQATTDPSHDVDERRRTSTITVSARSSSSCTASTSSPAGGPDRTSERAPQSRLGDRPDAHRRTDARQTTGALPRF